MACTVDPRMMDLVWTDRYEYEAVMYKRPACSQAEPSAAAAPTTSSAVTGSCKLQSNIHFTTPFISLNVDNDLLCY